MKPVHLKVRNSVKSSYDSTHFSKGRHPEQNLYFKANAIPLMMVMSL